MKVDHYRRLMAMQMNRRRMMQGAASLGAISAAGAVPGFGPRAARADAHGNVRAEILQIPGVGQGSPTDADWQRVGELCLGTTRARFEQGAFNGVELTFMGLNNQNLHNFLFRGFLRPWEEYTGATINWIDLAQADYNARLQQSIATGTVDFDIMEMGAPFEGDTAGRGLLDPMPEWVAADIDMDDYVDYLKAPVGTWDGQTYRVSIDGDCHTFSYRKDYYESEDLAAAWAEEGDGSDWAPPTTWEAVDAHSAFLGRKIRPTDRPAGAWVPRPAEIHLGWVRLLLPVRPGRVIRQASKRSRLALRSRRHDATGQQPGLGSGDPGCDGLDGRRGRLSARSAQCRSKHHRVPTIPWPEPAWV